MKLKDITGLREILSAEPDANLFFINDLELFGTSDITVHLEGGCYFLNFRDEGLCCYAPGEIDLEEAGAFIRTQKFMGATGPASTLLRLRHIFPEKSNVMERKMLYLTKDNFKPVVDEKRGARVVSTPDDVIAALALTNSIEEFADSRRPVPTPEEAREELKRTDTLRALASDAQGAVSTAAVSALARGSGMIVGVCTRKDMRGQGYAKSVLSCLLLELFGKRGVERVCLWHSDDKALAAYTALGFRPGADFVSIAPKP